MKRKLFLFILLVLGLIGGRAATAQIIDDSTQVVYSPKTTLQLYEQDVLDGRYKEQRIDTTIQNMHNERFWTHDTAYYQHLGNVGTASQPLLFRMPSRIGVRYGRHAFDRYAYDPNRINYYDTRSPYSHLFYVQGGLGEQIFEAIYARNITSNWNIGAAYQIISAEKQLAARPNDVGNGLVNSKGAKIFTHYRSKNKKYDLFANFTLLRHEQVEQGGVDVSQNAAESVNYFMYENGSVFLEQAATNEKRSHYHMLHMFKLAKENLKVFHQFDLGFQEDRFTDNAIPQLVNVGTRDTIADFYPPYPYFSRRLTNDRSEYSELQNIFGFTGNTKLIAYKAYVKQRSAELAYSTVRTVKRGSAAVGATLEHDRVYNQIFLGGQLRGYYKEKAELTFDGEFQVPSDYRLKGLARIGGAYASLERVLQSPTLTQQFMFSNHFQWDNEDRFNNSVYDRLEIGYTGKIGSRQYVKLKGHVNNIKRYFYYQVQNFNPNLPYNGDVVPAQAEKQQRLLGAELQHHIRFGPVHFENFVAYTNTDESDKIRVPEWVVDSKLYYEGSVFKKALHGQIGIQAYLPTAYFANGYMPVTQQFYVQNDLKTTTYPVVDVFLTADIKTLNVFLKMSHANYGLSDEGYFATPYYPGLRRSFTFGLKWMFFD